MSGRQLNVPASPASRAIADTSATPQPIPQSGAQSMDVFGRTVAIAAMSVLMLGASSAPAQTVAPWPELSQDAADARNNAELLWAALRDWRESLRAGVAAVTVSRTETDPRRGVAATSTRSEVRFDTSARSYRIDDFDESGEKLYAFVRTHDRSIVYNRRGHVVSIAAPSKAPGGPRFRPFDVSALPLLMEQELDRPFKDFEAWSEFLATTPDVFECTALGDEMYRLVLRYGQRSEMRRTLWFDASAAFLPVRSDLDLYDFRAERWDEGVADTVTEWTDVGGMHVPAKVACASRFNGSLRETVLAIEWLSLNEPVDAEAFDLSSLDLPVGTLVADERLGPAIMTRHGRDSDVLPMETSARAFSTRNVWWIVIINAAILLLIGVSVIVRQLTRGR